MKLEISLIEWPSDGNGPHFLGDLSDADLVEQVQENFRRISVLDLDLGEGAEPTGDGCR